MSRAEILKTYKIFIGGQFPRTESGRYYPLLDKAKNIIANICLSSRKDFRNAVVAARAAQSGWTGKTAFNRGQILYRIAEMLGSHRCRYGQLSREWPKHYIVMVDANQFLVVSRDLCRTTGIRDDVEVDLAAKYTAAFIDGIGPQLISLLERHTVGGEVAGK